MCLRHLLNYDWFPLIIDYYIHRLKDLVNLYQQGSRYYQQELSIGIEITRVDMVTLMLP